MCGTNGGVALALPPPPSREGRGNVVSLCPFHHKPPPSNGRSAKAVTSMPIT